MNSVDCEKVMCQRRCEIGRHSDCLESCVWPTTKIDRFALHATMNFHFKIKAKATLWSFHVTLVIHWISLSLKSSPCCNGARGKHNHLFDYHRLFVFLVVIFICVSFRFLVLCAHEFIFAPFCLHFRHDFGIITLVFLFVFVFSHSP